VPRALGLAASARSSCREEVQPCRSSNQVTVWLWAAFPGEAEYAA
jgi:hypothetical protein